MDRSISVVRYPEAWGFWLLTSTSGRLRQDKDFSGKVGPQGFLIIVEIKSAGLPREQIVISRGKLIPALLSSAQLSSFVNQKQKGPGDCLVVELKLSMPRRKSFQGFAESGQRL